MQARSSGGAGLGLAIVKAIVAAHEGSVALATDTTGGADVVLILPATITPSGSPPASRPETIEHLP